MPVILGRICVESRGVADPPALNILGWLWLMRLGKTPTFILFVNWCHGNFAGSQRRKLTLGDESRGVSRPLALNKQVVHTQPKQDFCVERKGAAQIAPPTH